MKKHIVSLSFLLACATGQAVAAADVSLSGRILPGACTPTLTNGGVVDFGQKLAADLQPAEPNYLDIGSADLTLSVSCTTSTRIYMEANDNRFDSRASTAARTFGLGKQNGENIGIMRIIPTEGKVNGSSAVIRHSVNGTTWSPNDGYLRSKQASPNYRFAVGGNPSGPPALITTMSMKLTVNALAKDTQDFSNDITLDGSQTFQLNYL